MAPSHPDISFPPPDLNTFDRLSRHVKLARANRLEELFADVFDPSDGPELVSPEPLVLAQGLFQHRQADILELANASLALFGLTAKPPRNPRVPWTLDAFDYGFGHQVSEAWWRLEAWREDVLVRWQDPRPASFADLDEFMRFLIPRLAMLPPWPTDTDSGCDFVPHIMGQRAWNELQARAARDEQEYELDRAYELVIECCQRTLVIETPDGPFPGLPEVIDRDALAVAARTEVEQALERFGDPGEGF